MNFFDIIITTTIALLLLWALIIFIRNPRTIIFSYLRIMKNAYWQTSLLFLPIWGPVWILDKIFKWGVFEDE